jgi:hypothetical protein
MTANLPSDAAARKKLPLFSGFLAYFPDAAAAVAEVSRVGNDQHNPGQPLHWDRSKSTDQEDCLVRHLLEAGTRDSDGLRHTAKLAWRALAMLQLEIEAEQAVVPFEPTSEQVMEVVEDPASPFQGMVEPDLPPTFQGTEILYIEKLGDPPQTENVRIVNVETSGKHCYEGGPMRGYEQYNFPAFDEGEAILTDEGWNVISPANLDREAGIDPNDPKCEETVAAFTPEDWKQVIRRDIEAILSLKQPRGDAIALLPGWESSVGTVAEAMLARWLNLRPIHALSGQPIHSADVDYNALCRAIHAWFKEHSP